MKWRSGASAAHGAKSGAGNVPLFYPGSGLAGRHARISGCGSYPTGQAACEREAVRGGSSGAARGGEGMRGGGSSGLSPPPFLFFSECKETRNGTGGWFLSTAQRWGRLQKYHVGSSSHGGCSLLLNVSSNVLHQNDETPVERRLVGAFSWVCSRSNYFL